MMTALRCYGDGYRLKVYRREEHKGRGAIMMSCCRGSRYDRYVTLLSARWRNYARRYTEERAEKTRVTVIMLYAGERVRRAMLYNGTRQYVYAPTRYMFTPSTLCYARCWYKCAHVTAITLAGDIINIISSISSLSSITRISIIFRAFGLACRRE